MSSVVNELPIIHQVSVTLLGKLSRRNSTLIEEDDSSVKLLTDRFESSNWVYGNIRSGAPIVICFSPRESTLRAALITYLTVEDITLILFTIEDHLWQWLDQNSSLMVAALVLEPTVRIQECITRSHAYVRVRSILVRCKTADLAIIQGFSRSLTKVHGIFADDTRILIKLVADLTLFSEELGDRQMEDEKNEIEAQRNYDRALKLCILVQKF